MLVGRTDEGEVIELEGDGETEPVGDAVIEGDGEGEIELLFMLAKAYQTNIVAISIITILESTNFLFMAILFKGEYFC